MKNKKVVVIGGAGFIGSHLVDYLAPHNDVLVLDSLVTGRRDFINKEARFEWCDITHSESLLRRIFEANRTDYVFNYAAEPYVPVSYERPLHVFDVNARGAMLVMNAAQDAGVKAILQVSSAEIYGDVGGKINEAAAANPHSTYGASKLAIDTVVQTRWREAKTPVISLRQFNCLGERDILHPYIIPEVIRQALKSDKIKLGNNTFRDFMYAGDAVAMAVELIEKGKYGEVYNLGSECGIQMYDLAHAIGLLMGKNLTIEQDPARCRPWDIEHLQSDNTKIYSVIDRRPEVSFGDALKRTVESYISYV